jgi:TROVE domain
VWAALIDEMPMTALIRNLATMTRVGVIAPRYRRAAGASRLGGAVAYEGYVTPYGVGYDIGCGNKASRPA